MFHLGIDLGGTNLAAAITNDHYQIICKRSVPTHAENGIDAIIDTMADISLSLLSDLNLTVRDFSYAGIGAPGIANSETGVLEFNANLGFYRYPLAAEFCKRTGFCKVALENDANAAALGEAIAGAGIGKKCFIMITLGTGVGGAIVIDGKILQGMGHLAGEFGHMVIENNGRKCSCGRNGCFEAYCSAPAFLASAWSRIEGNTGSLLYKLTEGNFLSLTPQMIFSEALKGDGIASDVLSEYIHYLACGISNLMNIFDPDVLCLGGGISEAGEILIQKLLPSVLSSTYGHEVNLLETEKNRIRLAKLGNDAGLIGAAWLRG